MTDEETIIILEDEKHTIDPTLDKLLGVLAHFAVFFLPFFVPLALYLATDDASRTRHNSRHVLNFYLSMFLYAVVAGILFTVLFIVGVMQSETLALVAAVIGGLCMLIFALLIFVTAIIGTIKAVQGKVYKYPLEIQFIKQ